MSNKSYFLQPMKTYFKSIESRIPAHLKVVGKVRLMWCEIVGDFMGQRSEVIKCEHVPKKDEHGQKTGKFHRRLIVKTENSEIQMAMTSYVSQYLDRLPKILNIHSMKFILSKTPINCFSQSSDAQDSAISLSEEQEADINKTILSLGVSDEDTEGLKNFLKIWTLQRDLKR